MTEKRKPYKTYTKAFKLEALRLMETTDRPASEIAMQLGIRRNQLYKWKVNLPQFNGHSKKGTIVRGVNDDKTTSIWIFGVRVKTQAKRVIARYRYEGIHIDRNVYIGTYDYISTFRLNHC